MTMPVHGIGTDRSVAVAKAMIQGDIAKHGKVSEATQERVVSVINADAKVEPKEIAAIKALVDNHGIEKFETGRIQKAFTSDGNPAGDPGSAAPTTGLLGVHLMRNKSPSFVKDQLIFSSSDAKWPNRLQPNYRVPSSQNRIKRGQEVLIPLEPQTIHYIKLKFQDERKLRELQFTTNGGTKFTGDELHAREAKEKSGSASSSDRIKRGANKEPWVLNPMKVKVDIVYPDGHTFNVGTKHVDFNTHDAYGPDSSGYPETDNINSQWDHLPSGELPPGCFLRLRPEHQNPQAWEKNRKDVIRLDWVEPHYKPVGEKKRVFQSSGWSKAPSAGFEVDPNRPIEAVYVRWTDNGGTDTGAMRLGGSNYRTSSKNVGSGEEVMHVFDGRKAESGRLFLDGGYQTEIQYVDVVYGNK